MRDTGTAIAFDPDLLTSLHPAELRTLGIIIANQDEHATTRMSARDIAAVAGISHVSVYRHLAALRKLRLVTQIVTNVWAVDGSVGYRVDDNETGEL